MEKKDIVEFFDRLALGWDADMTRDDDRIARILDFADIKDGVTVLDVACGTGVLVPDYLERDVKAVTGVDISSEMIRIARAKFTDPKVSFVNADIEEASFPEPFDRIVMYNALPHFPEPARFIARLPRLLAPAGRLTIAHGMSRELINEHHSGTASKVSRGLMGARELAAMFSPYFHVDVVLSEEIYVVSVTLIG